MMGMERERDQVLSRAGIWDPRRSSHRTSYCSNSALAHALTVASQQIDHVYKRKHVQYRTVWANCKRNRCTLHTTDGSIQARPTKAFVPQSGGVHVRLADKSDKFLPTSARSNTNNNECFKIRVEKNSFLSFWADCLSAHWPRGPVRGSATEGSAFLRGESGRARISSP